MIVLGIDPGTFYAGFAILTDGSRAKHTAIKLIKAGVLKLKRTDPLPARLLSIYECFKKLIIEYNVDIISLETAFCFKNPQTFMKLGYIRGLVYLLSEQYDTKVIEFAPKEIKKAIVGTGAGTKEDVAHALCKIFPELRNAVKAGVRDDITDAIAIGTVGLWKK